MDARKQRQISFKAERRLRRSRHLYRLGFDRQRWDEAITVALENSDYLVQERVQTSKEMFPMLDAAGNWQMIEQLVDLDPLLFNGIVGSAFTRLSSSELANVSSGGGMVPTFIIKEKE
jgi:hypothetical protein